VMQPMKKWCQQAVNIWRMLGRDASLPLTPDTQLEVISRSWGTMRSAWDATCKAKRLQEAFATTCIHPFSPAASHVKKHYDATPSIVALMATRTPTASQAPLLDVSPEQQEPGRQQQERGHC
jgi:hypothetical protein